MPILEQCNFVDYDHKIGGIGDPAFSLLRCGYAGCVMPSSIPTGTAIIDIAMAMASARSAGVHFRQSAIQSRISTASSNELATHDI